MTNQQKIDMIRKIYTREEIPTMLKLMGLTDRICELGVAKADNLWLMIRHTYPKYCLGIDVWDEKVCPKKNDYPIFFATSDNSGKDNSGKYIFIKDENGEVVLDEHGHPKIYHDLDEIAEAFINFAKEQKLSFWSD